MAKIEYTTYHFRPPEPIRETEYLQLKAELKRNPAFSLEDPNESFTNKFGSAFRLYLYNIPITVITVFILISIADACPRNSFGENFFGILGMFGVAWGMMTICMVPIFSLPTLASYASYLRNKRAYFSCLLSCIDKSSSYQEFRESMYGY